LGKRTGQAGWVFEERTTCQAASANATIHDDWVISASLCALLDQHVSLSQGLSVLIPAHDPLSNLTW